MQILYELVTVIRELKPRYHWETGKMANAMIFKPGDLPVCCTETIVTIHSSGMCINCAFREDVMQTILSDHE